MKETTYAALLSRADHRLLAYTNYTIECRTEFLEKNQEYGQTWLMYRPKSLLQRIWNKGFRIRSIQDKKEQLIGDTILSEFTAIYNYCIIALIVIEKMKSDYLTISIPVTLEPIHESLSIPYETAMNACTELFKKKDHDYDGAWVQMKISTIIDEVLVKLLRVASILEKDVPVDEMKKKLAEIFMDIANYAIFASILIKEVDVNPLS
jgi:hypothetical protein